MPEAIIMLQRRLTIVGAIRAGGEKQPKAPGRKLEAFRLTSPRRQLLEQAASLYGGDVSKWQSPTGEEWQLYTEAEELPVLVMPSYSLRQTYELWEGATKRMRLCDGVDEELTGGPCICNAEGQDKCDLYTRLVVALPELDTVLGWRLITRGANAAHELPTMFALMEARGGSSFVPSKLRLDQRRGVKDGQVVRFVVPTLDLGVGYLALAAPAQPDDSRALPPAGFVPAARRSPTIEQALTAVGSPPQAQQGRRAAAFGPDDVEGGDVPPEPEPPEPDAPPPPEPPELAQIAKASKAMKTKADILVVQLVNNGAIEKRHLYDAVAKMRGQAGEDLVLELGAYDSELVLHWSPLRESLSRPEAVQLLDRLAGLAKRTSSSTEPQAPPEPSPEEEAAARAHYNEFPPGY